MSKIPTFRRVNLVLSDDTIDKLNYLVKLKNITSEYPINRSQYIRDLISIEIDELFLENMSNKTEID